MQDYYIKSKGKQRLGKTIYTYEDITEPSFNSDYGRLVQKGYVFFDFDDQPYVDKIIAIIENSNLRCKMLKTTRGVHFLFKTNREKITNNNKNYNWLGLKCDVKGVGLNEEKQCYQAIKVNGILREEICINHNRNDGIDILDYAPIWLYQAPKNKQMDLTIDQTGGRNELFHNVLMITAKKNNFTYEEYCEMAHIINKYVLPSGIDENELNTAIRQEEWDKLSISNKDDILRLEKAIDVIEHFNCIIIQDKILFFDNELGHYSSNENTIDCYIQEKYANTNIRTSEIMEVKNQMEIQLRNYKKYQEKRNEEYIVCNNKLVSMWKDETKEMTRTIVTDVVYPYSIMTQEELSNYNGIGKKFLNDISCNNAEIEQIICECLGCMLAPTNHFGKIFIWYGSGANGKSVLVKAMGEIMGNLMTHSNILNINDKFALENVINGIGNVTDDVGITEIKETGILKSLIDGSEIEVNRKYKQPIKWQPNSQFIMCCNELPKINDTTNGMIRRLAFIPFNMQLLKDQIDYNLLNKLKGTYIGIEEKDKNKDALRYIMTKAIIAYREAFKNGHLTELEEQQILVNEFKEENKDDISLFYDYLLETHGDLKKLCEYLDGKQTNEIWDEYKQFLFPDNPKVNDRQFKVHFNRLLPKNLIKVKNARLGKNVFTSYCML